MHRLILFFLTISLSAYTSAQTDTLISKLILRTDSQAISWPEEAVNIGTANHLPFLYFNENEICEITVWPANSAQPLELISSLDYQIIDSLLFINDHYRFKLQFRNLTEQSFLKLSFKQSQDSSLLIQDIPLQPCTHTTASIYLRDNELFIGEEKVFEIITNNQSNLLISNEWISTPDLDYRFRRSGGNLVLSVVPGKLGTVELDIPLRSRKPYLDNEGNLSHQLPPLRQSFQVNASRLHFLNLDPREITLDEHVRLQGIEVQLDNSRLLNMNKTYRIENQEEPGGPLIAELFTKRRLANNKVLCMLRPYNFHRKSGGYLYIKEGDEARFITNLNVTPPTSISTISMLREDGIWKKTNTIYPGETLEVRLEGQGMHKANFYFEDLIDISVDTLIRSESQVSYKLQVPIDIRKKSISIFNGEKATGSTLQVAEFQKPREFEFIYLSYGDIGRKVSGIRAPILYDKTVKDVVISFNDNAIDKDGKLYGKQYIDIDLRITGRKNELIEMRSIENIVICPGENSPRFEYYPATNCRSSSINLNKYLSRKTYDLDEWSKISMTIKHNKNKYEEEGYQQEVELILKRNYSFDMEVSFPAGLITISKQDDGEVGFGNLSGISMAMIAQFSFYHPEKIAKYRPYKVGAGFLAFNAFNFSDNAENRDVGIVILGSLYPTKRDTKLSFPLYVGGGYFLKDRKWFFLIGPGIRVSL